MAEFRTRWIRQIVISTCVLMIVMLMQVSAGAGSGLAAGPATLVIILGLLGFSFWNWRCPACRRYLGRSFRPRFCSGCGTQLS